jgi:hypothetical protein
MFTSSTDWYGKGTGSDIKHTYGTGIAHLHNVESTIKRVLRNSVNNHSHHQVEVYKKPPSSRYRQDKVTLNKQ